MVIIGINYNKL